MPAIKINDLNNLRGAGNTSFIGAMNEGQQTVDKVKDIINGINNILTKVQSFKQQSQASVEQSKQNNEYAKPTPTPSINAPSDMQLTKRAIIHIEEDKILPQIKEFISQLSEDAKNKTLDELLKKFDGNEQVVKSIIIQLIKQNTKISYID